MTGGGEFVTRETYRKRSKPRVSFEKTKFPDDVKFLCVKYEICDIAFCLFKFELLFR